VDRTCTIASIGIDMQCHSIGDEVQVRWGSEEYHGVRKVREAYDSDLDEVDRIILASLEDNPLLLSEPQPRIRCRSLGDWAVELEVLAWIKEPRDRGAALDHIIRQIHRAYREGRIHIPFPQQEVMYKKDES